MEDGYSDPESQDNSLFGYASARLMDQNDVKKVLASAVLKSQSPINPLDAESFDLLQLLRAEIRNHFVQKYESAEMKAKVALEISKLLSVPFRSGVTLQNFHTDLLNQVTPSEFWEASRECMSILHPVQGDVYVMREMEDISSDDIASITGLSFETILELVYRGRMTFVECLLKRIEN